MKIKSISYWQFMLNYADDSALTLFEKRMLDSLRSKGLIHYDKKASYTESMGVQTDDTENTQEAEDQVYQLD
jgi:hypothetical protein